MTVRTITLFEKIGAVYIAIPKACNTSIKSELIFLETGKTVPDPHAKDLDMTTSTPGRLGTSIRRNNFVFTFVRNPWDRMVSLWADKCSENSDVNLTRWGIEKGMPFDAFVDRICFFPDEWSQIHFQSQTSLVFYHQRFLPAFIGRFENIQSDWTVVTRSLKIKNADRDRALPRLRTSQHNGYRTYYTQALAMKLGNRYAADAAFFGYAF